MKRFIVLFMFACFGTAAQADHHETIAFEKRQPDSPMTVTSVTLGRDATTINAEGEMGAYGRVYVTFTLTYDADRTSGEVSGEGRGVSPDGYVTGLFAGRWAIEDGIVVMRHVVEISDGTMNFDVVTFDPASKDMTIEVHVIK